jgi:hypothetical protein
MTPAQLDASVGASGPHDFAVRNTIARPCAADRSRETRPAIHDCAPDTVAPTASRRTSVTIAIRPFVGRDDRINKAVSTKAGSKIFLRTGLDTIVAEAPVGQISWLLVAAGDPTSFGADTLRRHSGARAKPVSPESITPVVEMAYYVYLLASRKHGTLDLGVTKDIVRRGYEHRTKAIDGFTTRYGVDKLV